jgi:HEPN superfamily RiboL-PSP-like protein
MPSVSLEDWRTVRRAALDEMEAAHRSVGGTGPGRRHATQQINQAYAVLLSSQFQGFCRDFHSECANYFVQSVPAGLLRTALRNVLVLHLRLKTGNPNPGNIGDDYNRFGLSFWDEVKNLDIHNQARRGQLDELNLWRNAIAHQDFDPAKLGRTTVLRLQRVRKWRRACDQLANAFEEVMRSHLHAVNGSSPW